MRYLVLFLVHLLVLTALSSLTTADEHSNIIIELNHTNFHSVLQSSPFTCVLFYDPNDALNAPRHQEMLAEIASITLASPILPFNFAQLNIRQHKWIRSTYNIPNVVDRLAEEYHDTTSSIEDPSTFLNFQQGTVSLPAKLMLFTQDFQLQASQDLTIFNTFSTKLQAIRLKQWLQQELEDSPWKPPQRLAPPQQERAKDEVYHANKDNGFDFVKAATHEEQSSEAEPSNTALPLEVGAQPIDSNIESIMPFSYPPIRTFRGNGEYYLSELGNLIDMYLAWIEGYEVSWAPERRAREDEVTKFGQHLVQLNNNLVGLVDRVFSNNHHVEEGVPNLKPFLIDVVFGMARSSAAMKTTIQEMTETMGATPEERRRNRHRFNGTEFPIILRTREFLEIRRNLATEEYRYTSALKGLLEGWYICLREFQENLSNSYREYYQSHNLAEAKLPLHSMDKLDLKSPHDYDLLTNYDAFHEKYTEAGIPVVLNNVEMFQEELTLDRIAEICPSADVTNDVRVSQRVDRDAAPTIWGGLNNWKLHDGLLNDKRKAKAIQRELDEQNLNEEEYLVGDYGQQLDEDGIDRSITMEQFAMLYQTLPDLLYLHDWGVPDECDRLLYNETAYDESNKFRIPSMIGSYDLFQRMQTSSYEKSWPSLFVGRKGSNSKLHIDSGATGFFMYLVSGRKRWIAYNRDERPFLYEALEGNYFVPDVLAMGKSSQADEFLSKRFPLVHRAEAVYEIIQEPGQLVYIPPDVPHAVENLDDTIGIAMNFVTKSGIVSHLQHQLVVSQDYPVFQIALNYLLLEDTADTPLKTNDPLYTSYGEYKAQY